MPPPFRIPVLAPVPVPLPWSGAGDVVDAPISTLQPRRDKDNSSAIKIVAFVLGALVLALVLAVVLRHYYRRHTRRRHTYQQTGREDEAPTRQLNRHNQDNLEDTLTETQARNGSANRNRQSATATVDRNTSVRSVMTLPVYRPKATETELVLGREGERDGIDMVVENRTAEDEEALRDEEMEALYQIRAARRRQISDREERRRQRREARDTHDVVALRQLRERTRDSAAHNTTEIEDLRTEHDRIRETRQRAVSSVSYADVGIARADGTRIRANSTDSSERVGLLSDTASIATESLHLSHRRDRSASATLSIDTSRTMHDRADSPGLTTGGSGGIYSLASAGGRARSRSRARANSAATTPRIPTPSPGRTTPLAGSSPEIIDAEDADLGDGGDLPPPGYDEVSLDEITPMHSRRNSDVSRRTASPYPDPPPDYPGPGPAERRNRRLSAHMGDLAEEAQAQAQAHVENGDGSGSRNGVPPTLPSLRLAQVPQIVIEPSSARP
ncbi:hypothetical protein C8A00DRAFT_44420 [Chaetomidium leptoderma]|uniref:Uncharacterized protein n=1 Tax=Chaetomidium leptoderma TaxID=669021 RepID=A0AAN6VJZ1_9PEZI|nr:hypothetical protein C8A00DRAFT_44420 [Chaetomidium leptoderma]